MHADTGSFFLARGERPLALRADEDLSMKAIIALEDGAVFEGHSFTGTGEAIGEIVFNSSLTGYQEILTDPSNAGHLVTMTSPLIGNSGINDEDMESAAIHPKALLIKENCSFPSHYRSNRSLAHFLHEHNVLGVENFDTRALTRHIRTAGAMRAVISTKESSYNSFIEKAKKLYGVADQNMVQSVTCTEPYGWADNGPVFGSNFATAKAAGTRRFKVVAYDFGIKYNQLRTLSTLGCAVQVVPASTPAEEVLAMHPDGVFLSSGPGNPKGIPHIVETIRALLGKKPIFGVCLGHQILGLACGAKSFKLPFGHRGGNQPVKNLTTGRVEITCQNHGFCIDKASLPPEIEITHLNLNDSSLEGMRHREYPAFSVQYQPDFVSSPQDTKHLFSCFFEMMG